MKFKQLAIIAIILCFQISSFLFSNDNNLTNPPIAKKIKHLTRIHDTDLIDNYFWMRNLEDPDVMEYLKAENNYTESIMKNENDLQEQIYNEIISRIQENDLSYPVRKDDYYYYFKDISGKNYSIYCRKYKSLDAKEEILFDPNIHASSYDFYSVGFYRISPDHSKLAYSVDTKGNERYTLFIKNLKTLEISEYRSEIDGFVWANDNEIFFYSTINEAFRSDKIYRHLPGNSPEQDSLIYFEKDEAYNCWVYKTFDKKIFVIGSANNITSECRYLEADNPTGDFKLIQPRKKGVEYYIYHHENNFYRLTNENAPNFKFEKYLDLEKSKTETIIEHRDEVNLNGVDLFKNYFVYYERSNGQEIIRFKNLKTGEIKKIETGEEVYSIWSGSNPNYDSEWYRYAYESYTTPTKILFTNLNTGETKTLKESVVKNYSQENYLSKKIYATSHDNVKIPISIIYNKNTILTNNNPLLLYGYGAYGSSEDPYFSYSRFSLLDRGFVIALAHVRGGGELGHSWYEQGKMLNKKNSFYDFIACSEYLIDNNFTSNQNLIITGGSAGGLLVGAVMNMRPDLFKAVIANVPFVDVINTMLDSSLPVTVSEYDEWGNPEIKEYYDYIKTYSPYENVEKKSYPHLLVKAGLNDARVSYWEPAKWVAKLREYKTDNNILILKTDLSAGHVGSSGRYDFYKDIAFNYAFMLKIVE